MIAVRQANALSIADDLAVEVLSESTQRTDLVEKRDAYLRIPSLKVLLLVDSAAASVSVHRRRTEGGFATEFHAGRDGTIPPPEIGTSLALAELYHGAELADV